jgi:hypothetical protein
MILSEGVLEVFDTDRDVESYIRVLPGTAYNGLARFSFPSLAFSKTFFFLSQYRYSDAAKHRHC